MSDFNKDDYLAGMDDVEKLKGTNPDAGTGSAGAGSGAGSEDTADAAAQTTGTGSSDGTGSGSTPDAGGADSSASADGTSADSAADAETSDSASKKSTDDTADDEKDGDELTPLGKAKKEAADYLEALQRERAEFVNFRNRSQKEQERFRQNGIIEVLTALLPALDDLDRIKTHGEMSDDLTAVATKLDRAFGKFGVEKFGEKGEEFDPTKHEAILHKPDPTATSESVDTVVEAGYKVGDRVVRAARVVVTSPSDGSSD